jgi:hypothetical protein
LIHGPELGSLTAYLEPLSEVQQQCGSQALACYDPSRSTLYAPGDDPSADLSAEAVVTHEYGHHVAQHRVNLPWAAVDYGTKRWATYEQVCARSEDGELHPGAETQPAYQLNPGEAFAETYRVLNERHAGIPEFAWQVVSQSLYPDDTALALVEQDVTSPWQATTHATRTAALSKRIPSRTYTVLDAARRHVPHDHARAARSTVHRVDPLQLGHAPRERRRGRLDLDDRLRPAHAQGSRQPRGRRRQLPAADLDSVGGFGEIDAEPPGRAGSSRCGVLGRLHIGLICRLPASLPRVAQRTPSNEDYLAKPSSTRAL